MSRALGGPAALGNVGGRTHSSSPRRSTKRSTRRAMPGDKLRLSWKDNKGGSDFHETTLT